MTKHRRWMMLYKALKQIERVLKTDIYNDCYDRCYELGICYEMVDARRKFRFNMPFKHKGVWYNKKSKKGENKKWNFYLITQTL